MAVMVAGQHPMDPKTGRHILARIHELSLRHPLLEAGHPCRDLIDNLTAQRPADRFSMEQAANHPWLQSTIEQLIALNLPGQQMTISDRGYIEHPIGKARCDSTVVKGVTLDAIQRFKSELVKLPRSCYLCGSAMTCRRLFHSVS